MPLSGVLSLSKNEMEILLARYLNNSLSYDLDIWFTDGAEE